MRNESNLVEILSTTNNSIKKILFEDISLENKQKMFAVSAFLDFILSGADVSVLPIKNNEATFVIKMK